MGALDIEEDEIGQGQMTQKAINTHIVKKVRESKLMSDKYAIDTIIKN